ncbi:MAG: TetR/AcrR family transcriptional regulator [Acidimicrobiales bacterium]
MSAEPTAGGRANQKARTREALLQAAVQLVRQGQSPSIPDVAERALISVATAYRYFPSAEELWFEASQTAIDFEQGLLDADQRIEAAGPDPVNRLEALTRFVGFAMLDDQAPFRRLAKGALEQWFRQVDAPFEDRVPVRTGRRDRTIAKVIEPLRDRLHPDDVTRIAHALTVVVGTDAMLAITDVAGLEGEQAKQALLDAARWLLAGALAELEPGTQQAPPPDTSRRRDRRNPARRARP